jgi:ABC-2 type transport system ATP-binding protein
MAVIRVQELTKQFRVYQKDPGLMGALHGLWRRRYETVSAVRDVSFQVEEGEMVGFLGPNGAGKTTTLKMLAGLLYPTSGTATVLGHVPWERHDDYRRQFALLLGQKNQLWWDLPARDSLELNGRIYGIAADETRRRIESLCDRLQVGDKLATAVRELSLGERMKFELVAALLHQPRILFLDEPTIGLDVVSQQSVREFLREYNRTHRTTILLTSHYMADIQQLCARVIIIDHGTVFYDGPLSGIIDQFSDSKQITVRLHPPDTLAVPATDTAGRLDSPLLDPSHRATLSRLGEVTEVSAAQVRLHVKRDQMVRTCKALLDELPVRDMDISEVPVEDIIRDLFARKR